LFMGFVVAAVFKIAQGSTTVSMITTSGMLAGLASIDVLGFHPVYLATAIGCGGLFGSWMNDSGFWDFTKMGALTEEEALKSWSIILAIMSVSGFLVTLVLATVMPLRGLLVVAPVPPALNTHLFPIPASTAQLLSGASFVCTIAFGRLRSSHARSLKGRLSEHSGPLKTS